MVGCEPKVTVAEDGDVGGAAGESTGVGGSGAVDAQGGSGGKGGSGPIGGSGGNGASAGDMPWTAGGGGKAASGGQGGSAAVAGHDFGGNSGVAGIQVEIRPATEEEDSVPEDCEFTFAPTNVGGSSGMGGAGGASGTDNVGGDGTGGFASDGASSAGSVGAGSADPPQCGCTRRPGEGTSFQCPWGEGLTVLTQIGPDGGSIQLHGTESTIGVPVEIRIPRGALEELTTISITELTVPPPDNLHDWSPLYRFEPADLEFARPVEVRVPWSGLSGEVATGLSLYVSSEPGGSCDMAPLSDNYVNAGFNQGSLWHLGWAIVGVPKAEGCP